MVERCRVGKPSYVEGEETDQQGTGEKLCSSYVCDGRDLAGQMPADWRSPGPLSFCIVYGDCSQYGRISWAV